MMSRMLVRRITTPLFRWPVSQAQAESTLTAAYRAEVYLRHRQFIDDEATRINITNVASALSALAKPKFGLIICGDCGNGKTTMMSAIRTATAYMEDEGLFTYETSQGGVHTMDVRFAMYDAVDLCLPSTVAKLQDIASSPLLIIEDLGQEPVEVQIYGNIFYPVTMVLERRYKMNLPTFITTNLTPDLIGKHYGKRIRDRLREMSFVVPFDNPSYRK